jgi:hypothetical protein
VFVRLQCAYSSNGNDAFHFVFAHGIDDVVNENQTVRGFIGPQARNHRILIFDGIAHIGLTQCIALNYTKRWMKQGHALFVSNKCGNMMSALQSSFYRVLSNATIGAKNDDFHDV